jgi:hypothetical protein
MIDTAITVSGDFQRQVIVVYRTRGGGRLRGGGICSFPPSLEKMVDTSLFHISNSGLILEEG